MTDYAALVEPRLGTNIGRWIAFSSACRPFGMVNLSPDCRIDGDWGCGYRYDGKQILGFSHIHAWQISGILMMPVTGNVDLQGGPAAWASAFDHGDEICRPGYHRVTLDRYGITAELTATLRVGYHRYTFPDGGGSILIDLASTLGPCDMGGASFEQTGPRTFRGHVINQPTVRKPKPLTIYFAIEISCEVTMDPFDAAVPRIRLRTGSAEVAEAKVAISYTSPDAAAVNMAAEADGQTFDEVRRDAYDEWNRWLSRIDVEGGTAEERGRFYTDLYASLLGRRTVSDYAGTYIDNTGPSPRVRQIPLDEAGRPLYRHFNSDSFWGAQWSIIPLWAIAYPELIDQFCRCFMDMYRNGGLIPRGPAAGNYTFVMTSAQTTPLYACGLNNGIYRPEDTEEVYAAVRKNHFPGGLMGKAGYEHNSARGGGIEDYMALGYIPEDLPKVGYHTNGAAQTIEHACHDHALAQIAQALGKVDDAESFNARSKQFLNLFDPSIGFARPRNRDGSWIEPYDPWSRFGWTEANGWNYTFHAPHGVPDLIDAFGSKEKFLARLEETFQKTAEKGYFVPHESHQAVPLDFGNEPALAVPYLFHLAGRPERTQYWLHEIRKAVKSGNAPTDNWAGDEDQGIMGAWSVLTAIGLFSPDGAVTSPANYLVTTPLFDRVTIHLNRDYYTGDTFVIESPRASSNDIYVQAARLNGQPVRNLQITHDQIAAGGVLSIDRRSEP